MIAKEEIIEWLMDDEYSKEEATEQINKAVIKTITTPITVIFYNNGVRDIITKDINGKIIHLNPYES